MSVEQMGIVWKLRLPHNQAWVLMALADHAHEDGSKCYPGVRRLAWKTGYSGRQVRRVLQELRDADIIEVVGSIAGGFQPTEYQLHLDRADKKSPLTPGAGTPDKMSATPDTVTSSTPDIAVSDEPSITINEPSGEPSIIDADSMPWVRTLRTIDGWTSKGEPHMASLRKWVTERGWTQGQLDAAATGVADMADKTLKGKRNLALTFQRRLNEGYDKPTRIDPNGRSPGGVPAAPGGPDSGQGGGWDNRAGQ